MRKHWLHLSAPELESLLHTSVLHGLSHEEADRKYAQQDPDKSKSFPFVRAFCAQLAAPLNVLILLVSIFLIAAHFIPQGCFLLAALIIKGVYLAWQNLRFCAYVRKRRKFHIPNVTVIRDGTRQEIPATRVLPGDLLELHTGDTAYFTVKIVTDSGLILLPPDASAQYQISDADKNRPFLLPGMRVAFGTGQGIVLKNDFLLPWSEKKIQDKKFKKVVWIGSAAAALVCALLVPLFFLKGMPPAEASVLALCMFLAVCPADLAGAADFCGKQARMRAGKAAFLSEKQIENLAQADTLVLREHQVVSSKVQFCRIVTQYAAFDMTADVFPQKDVPVLKMMQEMAVLCTQAKMENGLFSGAPDECAYIRAAAQHGIYKETLTEKFPYAFIRPAEKELTVGVRIPDGIRRICRGDPEALFPLCAAFMADGKLLKCNDEVKAALMEKYDALRQEGLMVCALAFSDNPIDADLRQPNLIFLGFLACSYLPHPEGLAFIQTCAHMQIQPVLLTRMDAPEAAAAARFYTQNTTVCTGAEIADMSDRKLQDTILKTNVFGGLSAEQETRVLQAFERAGKKTVMLVHTPEDLRLCAHTHAAAAASDAPEIVRAGCAGAVTENEDLPDLLQAAACICANTRRAFWQGMAVKGGILLFSVFSALMPQFSVSAFAYLWLAGFLMPLTYLFTAKQQPQQRWTPAAAKAIRLRAACLCVLFGGLALLLYSFARFTVPAVSPDAALSFAQTLLFWFLCCGVLLCGLHMAGEQRLVCLSLIANPTAAVTVFFALALTLVLQYIPIFRTYFGLSPVAFAKGFWLLIFLLLFMVAADLIKYIQFLKLEKEKSNERNYAQNPD